MNIFSISDSIVISLPVGNSLVSSIAAVIDLSNTGGAFLILKKTFHGIKFNKIISEYCWWQKLTFFVLSKKPINHLCETKKF